MSFQKSQAAFEFIILAGVMMAIFVMFFAIAAEKIAEMNNARRDKIAQDIIDTVTAELELAQQAMDGYTRNFTLPETVEGSSYELHINSLGEGKNLLSLMYMGKLYNQEIAVDISGEANSVYKGINQVRKKNGEITVFNGDDPCNKVPRLEPASNSYCIGGKCYCQRGYYSEKCTHEDDFETICGGNCVSFDHCNPPPAIIPIIDSKALVFADQDTITDTTAVIGFSTNESAKAVVRYGQADANGNCQQMEKEAVESRFSTKFSILLRDLRSSTKYCFGIEVTDQKGASQAYTASLLSPNSFTTKTDSSPPVLKQAILYPEFSPSMETYSYGQIAELIAELTDDTGVDLQAIKAAIKQEVNGKFVDVAALGGFRDTIEFIDCGLNPSDIGNEIGDNYYLKCFPIDNNFARYGSYSADADTLFYAGYDSSTTAEKGGEPSSSTGTDIAAGRYGNGVHVSSGDVLEYSAQNKINKDSGTVEFWVKRQWEDQAKKTFFDAGTDSDGIEIERIGSNIFFRIIAAGTPYYINPDNAVSPEWHFIAVTWDKLSTAKSEMHMYFDGQEIGEPITDQTINLGEVTTKFGVGDDLDEDYNADAIIDQFRILSRAKSPAEIKADYETIGDYYIYFEAKDTLGYTATYSPDQYAVSTFRVNYGAG